MIASSLKIMLWDKEIGRLSWDARKGVSFFEYNPAFLGGELDPFPLVASVKSPASRRPIMGNRETKLYRKLPPFLADSLPDAWGVTKCLSAGAYRMAFAIRKLLRLKFSRL